MDPRDRVLSGTWVNKTAAEIIGDMAKECGLEMGKIGRGERVISEFSLHYDTVAKGLDILAALVGCKWFVNGNEVSMVPLDLVEWATQIRTLSRMAYESLKDPGDKMEFLERLAFNLGVKKSEALTFLFSEGAPNIGPLRTGEVREA